MTQPLNPTRVVAEQMVKLRRRKGWSAERLGEELARVGIPWNRSVVANLEHGRRPSVSVEELLALAFVLDVAPIHLLVPTEDDERLYAIAPEEWTPATEAREWIRGRVNLYGQDPREYFSWVPAREWAPKKMSDAEIELESRQVRRQRDGER